MSSSPASNSSNAPAAEEEQQERMAAGAYGFSGYVGGYPPVAYPSAPAVAQPGGLHAARGLQWAPRVGSVPGCPAGLEYLSKIDTVIVEQLVEMMEVLTGYETANRYIIRNGLGQQVYFAFEVSSNVQKQFGGKDRAFTMVLVDNMNRQVCRIHRPQVSWMSGGSQAVVEAPLGVNIGYIRQHGTGFLVMDASNRPFFQIVTPMIPRGTVPFSIVSMTTMQPVGTIVKHWGGTWKEMHTDADTFSLHVPLDLNPQMKAVLTAAVFIIDFMYFEDTANDQRRRFA